MHRMPGQHTGWKQAGMEMHGCWARMESHFNWFGRVFAWLCFHSFNLLPNGIATCIQGTDRCLITLLVGELGLFQSVSKAWLKGATKVLINLYMHLNLWGRFRHICFFLNTWWWHAFYSATNSAKEGLQNLHGHIFAHAPSSTLVGNTT